MGTVTFVDETTLGGRTASAPLAVAEERLPLRELIARRVALETGQHGQDAPDDPDGHEAALGRALDAFSRNGFLVLVGDRQIEDLDETVALGPDTEVVFLRLVPLVGG
ncbi:hypothetical protein HHL19_12640 [Streptomyces sp. R302]|uniref:hypothetical protein n=1 Tax=unclassified Streptomyces TaxID=2593676 RepID=UPI00145D4FD8|nr:MULTISPECIES: hypothetical protein [unclassified Streptomyces]NML50508.1 hypothetical protein [Streptomyces sp. R301]NML79499.1 hypothetical protein [Streptomyces sp. R302]